METLRIFDYLLGMNVIRLLKMKIRSRSYSKHVLDKQKYIGLPINHLLNLFPDSKINTLSNPHTFGAFKSNPIYAEVRIDNGTMLFVFEKLTCIQVEYFSDRKV